MKLSLLPTATILEVSADPNIKSKFLGDLRRNGTSQERLADEIGVDPSTVSRLKKGIRKPSLALMKRLAAAGIDVVEVWGLKSGGGEAVSRDKPAKQRSKAGSSRVSEKMRTASEVAKETEKYNEPHDLPQ